MNGLVYAALLGAGAIGGAVIAWRLRARFSRPALSAEPVLTGWAGPQVSCPVCGGHCTPLDVVDFSKSCEELRGKFLQLSGIPVYYYLCSGCRFCFAPWIAGWSLEEFAERIYNRDYILVDPDYLDVRPRGNAQSLMTTFGERAKTIRHLDYGGGGGLLSRLLNDVGWQSQSYDPFVQKGIDPATLGRFDLITAYEVFEHVPDPAALVKTLAALLAPGGIILFSTMLTEGHIVSGQRIKWWYASPRNGHISLYSGESLTRLGAQQGFSLTSFSDGFHMYRTTLPDWASHLAR